MASNIDPVSQQLDNTLHQYLLDESLPLIDNSSDLQRIDHYNSLLDPSLQNQSAAAIYDGHDCDQRMMLEITKGKSSSLRVCEMEYLNDLPEYPSTHQDGYAYVVFLADSSSKGVENMIGKVQYSTKQRYKNRAYHKSSFLGGAYYHSSSDCQGVKLCEFASTELKSLHHSQLNDYLCNEIYDIQKDLEKLDEEPKTEAYKFYSAAKSLCGNYGCLQKASTCALELGESYFTNVLGMHEPYIRCVNTTSDPANHLTWKIPMNGQVDIPFLQGLVKGKHQIPEDQCGVIKTNISKSKCGISHPQGSGALKHHRCAVRFHWLVPQDLGQRPYLIFISYGVHTHPPPPPNKPPPAIVESLIKLIQECRLESFQPRQFCFSDQFMQWLQEKNQDVKCLAELHAAFANLDKLRAILHKQRLIAYPFGQDINGVLFQRQKELGLQKYATTAIFENGDFLVICLIKAQAELWLSLPFFQLDASHKRVHSSRIKEVVFAAKIRSTRKIITLCRCFITGEDQNTYARLFWYINARIKELTGQVIHWKHIDGDGWQVVTLDMDRGQLKGLASFIKACDKEDRDELWHIQNSIRYCHIHFQRGIDETLKKGSSHSGVRHRMNSLLYCQTEEEYIQLIDLLKKYEDPHIQRWATHKKSPMIASGLNRACSLVSASAWNAAEKDTNTVEQTHNKSNQYGKHLTLLQAIKISWGLDVQDINQYKSWKEKGVRHQYHQNTLEDSYRRHMKSTEKRKHNQQSAIQQRHTGSDSDVEILELESQGTSTGRVSTSKPQRKKAKEHDNASEVQKLQQAIKLEELKIQLLEKQKHRQQLELDP